MIAQGLLDKYGKPNEKTPVDWTTSYVDYSKKPEESDAKDPQRKRKHSGSSLMDTSMDTSQVAPDTPGGGSDSKKEKKKKKKRKKEENGDEGEAAAQIPEETVETVQVM